MTTEKDKQVAKPAQTWEWETPHGLVKLSLDLVRRYFCADATEPEVMHFLAVCKYHKINPWLREAYLIKYDRTKPAQIVVGKDFYNRRAQEFPTYKGHAAGIILQVKDPQGKVSIERRSGAFHTGEETLLGGWARVVRSDLDEPVEIEVQLKEYDKDQALWKTMKATLIRKVALSQCWREAYPKEFARSLDEAEVTATDAMTIDMPMSNAQAESSARPPQGVNDEHETSIQGQGKVQGQNPGTQSKTQDQNEGYDGHSQECAMHGLREDISPLRDGLRSREREQDKTTLPSTDSGIHGGKDREGSGEVRGGVRKLSSRENASARVQQERKIGAAATPTGDTQLSLAKEARARERSEEKARNG